jgi:hypothetical protein
MYNDFKFEKERAIMVSQTNPPDPKSDKDKRSAESQRGMLSLVTLLMSAISFGIALVGGAMVVFTFVENKNTTGLWAKLISLSLAYIVGWIAALVGIRKVGNLILPYVVNAYTWACLAGVGVLYIKIIQKLYLQQYGFPQFGKYVIIMVAALVALIGMHLLIENHNLVPFAIPLLIISLAQLYLIVFHYVFTTSVTNYAYLWGDLAFFTWMTAIGILMIIRVGVLNSVRKFLTKLFEADQPSEIN